MLVSSHQAKIMTQHPCFNDSAHNRIGRVHLPIAPRCNIQCNFCVHNFCAALIFQHPGWSAKLMSVTESVDLIRSITRFKGSTVFVVGIAGPGDPLANDQTFEALDRIHKEHPHLIKCMSTNGLLLEDKLEDIINVGISALTITINAADNKTGETIYSWINYNGIVYYGEEAADILLSKQLKGMSKAAQAGLSIKVNTVYIPGTNDFQMSKLANLIKKAGAKKMNIMPLIPAGNMINKPRPSCSELIKARQICERIIPQFNYCEQCRSDIIYFP